MTTVMTLPRGIRLNNPGCLERIGIDWRGLAPDQSVDPRLVAFTGPEWGIRALARTLLGYQHQEARHTIAGLVSRFRPPEVHDTSGYCRWVATSLDREATDRISLDEPATLMGIVQAIIRRENGPLPSGRPLWYPHETVARGLKLAFSNRA
ncbi:MAG TPA: structural protein [Aliidongia sp.]|uniref:structural protein n=1 Tax=Aliidongia sp. TaxID=1914230 RepID=UPI002DDD5B8D|nr:structural protein [Aliidongia sp.]HEV2678174.1 structural protein [Aliidongia sp.]